MRTTVQHSALILFLILKVADLRYRFIVYSFKNKAFFLRECCKKNKHFLEFVIKVNIKVKKLPAKSKHK